MYTNLRMLEQELVTIARQRGYNGTPFLRETPPVGYRDQELAAIELSLSVRPRPKTARLKGLWCDGGREILC